MQTTTHPTALIILDGWGHSDLVHGNAIAQAPTPVFDRLLADHPNARLQTSGTDVGLPDGQFGNSEVGHLNLGAGFVVDQDLTRIDRALADGSLAENAALLELMHSARARGAALHMIGLTGQGGVHAHARHLETLLKLAAVEGPERLYVHALTDGRDSPPRDGLAAIDAIEATLVGTGVGRIASVGGRYYAMDRDRRWERTALAWDAMVAGEGQRTASAHDVITDAYSNGVTDEFIDPTVIEPAGDDSDSSRIRAGDAVLLFNFRADRMRQLLSALTELEFDGFDRELPADLHVVTLTRYQDSQLARAAFDPIDVQHPLARVVSEAGLRQFHAAETEKYAHVTYFFNGGRETPFSGEERLLVQSPRVPTYDLLPKMSAEELTDGLLERIESGVDAFIVVNYANPDMVGHTGVLEAAIEAVATVDRCLGRLLAAIEATGGRALITADHGNCETMIDVHSGEPHTSHTTNPVPIVLFDPARASGEHSLQSGRLADVAPTLLEMMELPAPAAMTGRSLIHGKDLPDGRDNRVLPSIAKASER